LTYLNNYTDRILSEEREVIELELEGIGELTEIKSEEKDIEERLRNVIEFWLPLLSFLPIYT
jgi:hypothetical protein